MVIEGGDEFLFDLGRCLIVISTEAESPLMCAVGREWDSHHVLPAWRHHRLTGEVLVLPFHIQLLSSGCELGLKHLHLLFDLTSRHILVILFILFNWREIFLA